MNHRAPGCTTCIARLQALRKTWDEMPAPEETTPMVRERTQEAYVEFKAAWAKYRAFLSEDCLDHQDHEQKPAPTKAVATLEEISERHGWLDHDQRRRVRDLAREGRLSKYELASMFGISPARVMQLKLGYQ